MLAQILDIDLESPEARAFQPMMGYFTARILSDLDVEGHDTKYEPAADQADRAPVV